MPTAAAHIMITISVTLLNFFIVVFTGFFFQWRQYLLCVLIVPVGPAATICTYVYTKTNTY